MKEVGYHRVYRVERELVGLPLSFLTRFGLDLNKSIYFTSSGYVARRKKRIALWCGGCSSTPPCDCFFLTVLTLLLKGVTYRLFCYYPYRYVYILKIKMITYE